MSETIEIDKKRPLENTQEQQNKKKKLPKKRVAVILGYIGTNYCGLQFQESQPDIPTIEKTVYKAMSMSGGNPFTFTHFQAVSQENSNDFRKDKGVHALVNVVSLKVHYEDGLAEKINEHLPSDIRVYDLVRTTSSFNPKRGCSGRIYEYMIPTFCFEMKGEKSYRITKEKLEQVRALFQNYVGMLYFHNFTRLEDGKAKTYYRRTIKAIDVLEPVEYEGIEYCSVMINGESFLLHMIRKMIGMIVSICQEIYTADIFKTCFERDVKVNTPMAPGIGLALNILFYDYYNNHQGHFHGEIEMDKYKVQREALRTKVHAHIAEQEVRDQVYVQWIPMLHNMKDKDYFVNEEKETAVADDE